MIRRQLAAAALVTFAGLAVASPALAHIDPDPTEAQAGSEISVGFTVEHGCDGSATVQLDMRLPDGVTNPVAEPPDAWVGSVASNVVTFEGGPLPDDEELTFRVRMVLPSTPDATIYFPFVQRCEVGEIRWIDIPTDDSGAELDEPAPAMQLFGPVATTILAPTTAPAPDPTTPPASTTPTTTATATTTPATIATIAPASTAPVSVPASGDPVPTITAEDSDDGGASGTVVFALVLAAVALAAGIVFVQARRRRP